MLFSVVDGFRSMFGGPWSIDQVYSLKLYDISLIALQLHLYFTSIFQYFRYPKEGSSTVYYRPWTIGHGR